MNRILRRILIGLAMLTGIPVFLAITFLFWVEVEAYWTVDTKFEANGVGEMFAVKVAQGYDGALMGEPCDWGHPSIETPRCRLLSGWQRRNACRWWFWERCQPYNATDVVLENPEVLGRMIHGIIDPCLYHQQSKNRQWSEQKISHTLPDWCRNKIDSNNQRRPVVIIFKRNNQEDAIRMRIDFPDGFTTAAREKIIKAGVK